MRFTVWKNLHSFFFIFQWKCLPVPETMSALYSGKSLMSGAFPSGNMQQLVPPRYENVQEIGKGAYSAVYKGRDRQTEGRYVAMKEVRIPLNSEEGIPMTTVREIGLLRQLDKFEHPNVVRYYMPSKTVFIA